MSTRSALKSITLALQLCLGIWQIMKLTPAGAVIRCFMEWCIKWCLPFFSSYPRLQRFHGCIFKAVRCHVNTAAEQPRTMPGDIRQIQSSYLGVEFHLERREGNELFLNGHMAYYITDKIWHSLLFMAEVASETVFLKGSKEFWHGVVAGGVMSLSEVLDCLILENHAIITLDNIYLLPVNLSVSEEKIPKVLNLVGLFVQTKNVYWLVPIVLSLIAAVLEFSTPLRLWLYGRINALFCFAMRFICDLLSRPTREQAYSLGYWVENLAPRNDIELRVLRGNICAVIGGGAKVGESAILVQPDPQTLGQTRISFLSGSLTILGYFDQERGRYYAYTLNETHTVGPTDGECTEQEFDRLITFLSCVASNCSGSLKRCSANNVVLVRGFKAAVMCYARSGFPPVYQLQLQNTVVI